MILGLFLFIFPSLALAKNQLYDYKIILPHPWPLLAILSLTILFFLGSYFILKKRRTQPSSLWDFKHLLKELFWTSMTWLIMGHFLVGGLLQDWNISWFKIYYDKPFTAYYFLSFIVVIFLHDTYFYWTHRMIHSTLFYSWVHRHHHLSTTPSPLTAYNFSVAEAFVQFMVLPLILLFMPLHWHIVLAFVYAHSVYNIAIHSGINLVQGSHPILGWLAANNHHDYHHQYQQGNYSLYFNFWDRIMKTTIEKSKTKAKPPMDPGI